MTNRTKEKRILVLDSLSCYQHGTTYNRLKELGGSYLGADPHLQVIVRHQLNVTPHQCQHQTWWRQMHETTQYATLTLLAIDAKVLLVHMLTKEIKVELSTKEASPKID